MSFFVGSYTNPNTTLVTTFQYSNPSSLITFMGAPLLGLQTYAIKEPSGENDGKLPFTIMEDNFPMAMSQIQPRDPLEGWTNHQGEFLYICGT
jgi:hypothetical protein